MTKKPKQGDGVSWPSHGQAVEGTVRRAITEEAGRTVRASNYVPQHLVDGDRTGRAAVPGPAAPRKKIA